jgi:hypothetical protein
MAKRPKDPTFGGHSCTYKATVFTTFVLFFTGIASKQLTCLTNHMMLYWVHFYIYIYKYIYYDMS